MKTLLIATFVGALILYIFLFLAHNLIPLHTDDLNYTPAQDSIMKTLSSTLTEDGMYRTPFFPPGATHEEMETMMKSSLGKPWAMIAYHTKFEFSFMAFIMSFVYNLIAVFIVAMALAAASGKINTFTSRIWFVMLFALFAIFGQVMLDYNWYQTPMNFLTGSVIDLILGYFFVGVWLAWYYGRQSASRS